MPRTLVFAAALAAALSASAHAQHHAAARPEAHAPIGVMGDHLHPAGEVMLSYRYVRMGMDGNRDGTDRVSGGAVIADPRFAVTPTEMDMEMHVLGGMWAPDERVTLTAMLPFVRKDMDHRTALGTRFTTRANGLGDVRLGALVRVLDGETHGVHLNAGVSAPTGRISAQDETPMGRQRLPYPMQLGTGTWDLLPGVTYAGHSGTWAWGGQLLGTYRVGENRKGYQWGHAWQTSAWLQRRLAAWLAASLRVDYREWNDVRGRDRDLAPIVPTASPELRAGRRLDLLLGANLVVPRGPLRGHRLALELGRPVVQDLDGPQLETDWLLTVGWQWALRPAH